MSQNKKDEMGKDLFRDTAVRYLGYANEVGEAFRHLVKREFVIGTYIISTGYVFADAVDKSLRKYRRDAPLSDVAIKAADVFTWQILASVIIPGYTINRVAFYSRFLLMRLHANAQIANYVPTIVGLGSIPIIIHPIDKFTDYLMDNTFRKVFGGD